MPRRIDDHGIDVILPVVQERFFLGAVAGGDRLPAFRLPRVPEHVGRGQAAGKCEHSLLAGGNRVNLTRRHARTRLRRHGVGVGPVEREDQDRPEMCGGTVEHAVVDVRLAETIQSSCVSGRATLDRGKSSLVGGSAGGRDFPQTRHLAVSQADAKESFGLQIPVIDQADDEGIAPLNDRLGEEREPSERPITAVRASALDLEQFSRPRPRGWLLAGGARVSSGRAEIFHKSGHGRRGRFHLHNASKQRTGDFFGRACIRVIDGNQHVIGPGVRAAPLRIMSTSFLISTAYFSKECSAVLSVMRM